MSKPSNSENSHAASVVLGKSRPETEKDKLDGDKKSVRTEQATEFGGQKGPEPTRYGDWEKNGRCTDF